MGDAIIKYTYPILVLILNLLGRLMTKKAVNLKLNDTHSKDTYEIFRTIVAFEVLNMGIVLIASSFAVHQSMD